MIVVLVLALVSGSRLSLCAVLNTGNKDEVDQALEIGEAIEQERTALSERDQAMLEAIVDEAIRQEELLRNRRTSGAGDTKQAKDRLSSYEHGPPPDEYGPPPLPTSYKDKSFSLWSFKKMVFNALLQAVKAITGGVIALKGQIVKVKGHLVAAKGKLLETKGDAITEFGKHLATKALLTPVHVSNFDHNSPDDATGPDGPYPYPPPIPGHGHPPMLHPMQYPPHPPPPAGPPRPPYGRPPVWMMMGPPPSYGPPRQEENAAPAVRATPQPVPTMMSPSEMLSQFQTWPLSPLQVQALANLYFPPPLFPAAPTSPPPVYGPPVISHAPYPPSMSHSSYGPVNHASDYSGPPPTNYGVPSTGYGGPPTSSHNQYLPPSSSSYGAPPSGFTAPSGPSYPSNFESPNDGWNKRGLEAAHKKTGLPDGIHAGLIVLKPIKSAASEQHSVYRPPQGFSKSSNSRVDEDKTQLYYTNNKESKT